MGFEIPVDVDYFDHPKTILLMGLIGTEADVYPLRLWMWCAKYAKNGRISGGAPQIESAAEWTGKSGKLYSALMKFGFIEGDGVTVSHVSMYLQEGIKKNDALNRRILDSIADRPIEYSSGRPDLSSSKWKRLRKLVISEEGAICFYCKVDCSEDPTVDHVNPVSNGGKLFDRSNLVVACRPCNSKKGGVR